MPGVVLDAFTNIASLKYHKNLLEGIKYYSKIGTSSKDFLLETCFILFFFPECIASSRTYKVDILGKAMSKK